MKNIAELLGCRVLISTNGIHSAYVTGVDEVRVLEISPSGNWVKLMMLGTGRKYWRQVQGLLLVEELAPPPEKSPAVGS